MPFVPFIIIVTNAVQTADVTDLARLEAFVESLKPSEDATITLTHPYRLYGLLCQIARSSIESSSMLELPLSDDLFATFGDFDFSAHFGMSTEPGFGAEDPQFNGLAEWYHNNQQIMSFFDGDAMLGGT